MTDKLLTEQHLEFLSLKGGCTVSSESTLVKMPHWRKSHSAVHIVCLAILTILCQIEDNANLINNLKTKIYLKSRILVQN